MIQSLTKGKCGGCGGDSFKLYTNNVKATIIVECEGCGDFSHITISTPTLKVGWDDASEGILHFDG